MMQSHGDDDRSAPDVDTVIRAAGLKLTAPRAAVVRSFETLSHASAEQIFDAVRDELPGTSLQAVYGVLGALTDAGIIRRIQPAGSPARYERRVGDNHHHLICTGCGTVRDVDCDLGHAPCITLSDTYGFAVATAELTFWGLCPSCLFLSTRSSSTTSSSAPSGTTITPKENRV